MDDEVSRELLRALQRIAAGIEAVVLHGFGVDLNAALGADEPAAADRSRVSADFDQSEILAAIELLEDQGIPIPPEIYRDWGVEPPRPDAGDIPEEVFDAEQPQPRPKSDNEEAVDEPYEEPLTVFHRIRYDAAVTDAASDVDVDHD